MVSSDGSSHVQFIKIMRKYVINLNVENDMLTRDANSVSRAEIWEFSKSQYDIIDAVTI